MDNKVNNNKDSEVRVKQINPQKELSQLEKTAILQFKLEQKEEELSKTQQFERLNAKRVNLANDLSLPKKKASLTDTIKLKISDLREAIEEENIELPTLKKRKSLYDTVIIKLDDIINNKKALKTYYSQKVTNIERPKKVKRKLHLRKPRDLTKIKDFKLNVDSEEFGRQLYNLNRVALINLSNDRPKKIRKYSQVSKLEKIEKIHISKNNYLLYQKKLSKFAINKLYYK